MDLEFVTAVLHHEDVSKIVMRLRKYESAFVVLFDNMTYRLAVSNLKYLITIPLNIFYLRSFTITLFCKTRRY